MKRTYKNLRLNICILRNKEKAYLKKIDYKSNELKEQKNEIKDLKQRNEKMKQLNQSIEQIIETSRLNETVIKESSLSKSRISIDTPRNVNTSFDNIPINKSIALPSLNNARLKSELKNSYASPLNARKSHKMAFNIYLIIIDILTNKIKIYLLSLTPCCKFPLHL